MGWRREAPSPGVTLIAGFASTVCWPVSAALEARYGWRITCFVWAGAHIFIALPLNRFLIPSGSFFAHGEEAPAGNGAAIPAMAMMLLAFVFAVTWFISTAMAAHLPLLLQAAGASPASAIVAAACVGPAQVAARLFEFGLLRRFHPLLSARLAGLMHPLGAGFLLVFGAPSAVPFAIMHGAGNGILTIAKGTLPLVLFGPAGYGLRQGVLMVPARIAQAAAPFAFALPIERTGATALIFSALIGASAFLALLALAPTTHAGPR